MPGCGIQLFLSCLCILISLVIYHAHWWPECSWAGFEKEGQDLELVKSIRTLLKSKLNIFALLPCGSANASSRASGVSSCMSAQLTDGCVYAAFCILWKEAPDSNTLVSVMCFVFDSLLSRNDTLFCIEYTLY